MLETQLEEAILAVTLSSRREIFYKIQATFFHVNESWNYVCTYFVKNIYLLGIHKCI